MEEINIAEGFVNHIKSGSYVLVEVPRIIFFLDNEMYYGHYYAYIEDILPVDRKIRFRFQDSDDICAKYNTNKKRFDYIFIRELTAAEKLEWQVIDYLDNMNYNEKEYSKEEIEYINTYLKYKQENERNVPKFTPKNIITGGLGYIIFIGFNYFVEDPNRKIPLSIFAIILIVIIVILYLIFRQQKNNSKIYRFLLNLKAKELGLNK